MTSEEMTSAVNDDDDDDDDYGDASGARKKLTTKLWRWKGNVRLDEDDDVQDDYAAVNDDEWYKQYNNDSLGNEQRWRRYRNADDK